MTSKLEETDNFSFAGWIRKKGHYHGLWHKRFALLTNFSLKIFKDDTLSTLDQELDITPDTIIDTISSTKFVVRTQENSISISLQTPEECMRWVTAIKATSLPSPKLTMNDFKIISVIGRGYYGKVMLVEKKDTGELFAIKSIHKSFLIEKDQTNSVILEKNLMMKARHPFIVNLYFTFQTTSKFYLGLEYIDGGDLFYHMSKVGAIPVDDAKLYIAEIGLAISYLHSIGIVYRDLKPENVLLDHNGHVKLVDFGLSKDILDNKFTTSFCGTPEYIAPEIIEIKKYGYEVDEWALGILFYEMIFGYPPFKNENKMELYNLITKTEPAIPDDLNPALADLLKLLLIKDPEKRPKFNDLKSHPFFSDLDWEKVYNKEYTPSYLPESRSKTSVMNFDPNLTNEPPADSFVLPAMGDVVNVTGFSFIDTDIK